MNVESLRVDVEEVKLLGVVVVLNINLSWSDNMVSLYCSNRQKQDLDVEYLLYIYQKQIRNKLARSCATTIISCVVLKIS